MMTYKSVTIIKRESGKYQIRSPFNGTIRIFETIERAKRYIDKYQILESHAAAMGW